VGLHPRTAGLNVLASTSSSSAIGGIIFERTAALGLPAMYQWPETAEEGGLAGYGPRITQWFRQLARLLVKVLRGAKPADLPVEQPTRFELGQRFLGSNHIRRPRELVRPCVDDGVAINVLDAGHDALLEFLL